MMRWMIFFLATAVLVGCGDTLKNDKKAADPIEFAVITHGAAVELEPHVKKGGITVFDFYADWCPPCKKLDRSLMDLKRIYGGRLEVIKLDLVDWESELAKQYEIKDLPYLMVYDRNGVLLKRGQSSEVLPVLISQLNAE